MKIDMAVARSLDERGLLTMRPHDTLPLFILNYTPKVQFDKLWGEHPYLPMARGLIVLEDGYVVARPFQKFFNLGEHQGLLPLGDYEVTAKVDGSLGIAYPTGNRRQPWAIATRGSFNSEQAIEATRILHEKYAEHYDFFRLDRTYLFEIIYPENRIVVNYGGMRDLIMLAEIDTETGRDLPPEMWQRGCPFNYPAFYLNVTNIDDLALETQDNFEGYVVRWLENDYRLKVKLDEYLRLHKVLTGVNARTIWQALKNGDNVETWMEAIPDEFADYIRTTAAKLQEQFDRKETACQRIYDRIVAGFEGSAYPDRKQFAMEATKTTCPDIMFLMFDGRDCSGRIWQLCYPEADAPFKMEMT